MIRVEFQAGMYAPFQHRTFVRIKDIVKCVKITSPIPESLPDNLAYPVYQIFVINHEKRHSLLTYIIHKDDRYIMERVLKGIHHPMTELVDELQNHPSIGIAPKLDFDQLMK